MSLMRRNQLITLTLCYLLIAACSKKQADEIKPAVPEAPGTAVTFTAVVNPLFQTKCNNCHAPGRQAATIWSFNGYATVTANADRIKQAVLVNKSMPLGGTLSAAELQSLQDWFDQGMKE